MRHLHAAWRGISIGLGTVIAVTVLKLRFNEAIGQPTPFLLYFSAILVAAWSGGWLASILVTFVSAVVGSYFFLSPYESFDIGKHELVQLALFFAEGLSMGYITAWLQKARVAAEHLATQARKDEQRLDFVSRATAALNASLDYQVTLATVARAAVPAMADWCAVDVLEGGRIERIAVAHVDPAKIDLVSEIERRYPTDPASPTSTPSLIVSGHSVLVPRIPVAMIEAAARDAEHLRLIRQLNLAAYIAVPLKRGDKAVGVITLAMAESGRHYDEDDLELAKLLADRAAVAIENARLFRDIAEARTQAEHANRSKDEFLAMLGHELRNPLAPIVTALELMKLRAGDAADNERAVIDRQVKHVVRLVDDLLDVSRITRGKVELEIERLAVADVVTKALEMASPLIEARQQKLEVTLATDLWVAGDSVRLAQVVSNLLNNAAKYTDRGGHIRVSSERQGERAVLRIRDNGVGIAAEFLPHVFDLFVQERQALDRSQGGLGLGLAIVRSLVAQHGGEVTAKSAGVGQGTEVTVSLPLSTTAVDASPRRVPLKKAERALRVLVVDDNVDAAELLCECLQVLGHEARAAHDGPQALAVAATFSPQVALLDIGLPVMDGYTLARLLRELPDLRALKLIAVTGYGQASDRALSAAAGFDEHLVKPVNLEALAAVVTRLQS